MILMKTKLLFRIILSITVSLFSFINLQPDSLLSWIYLFYFPMITAAWFSFVSYALTHEALGDIFDQYNPKIQFQFE